MVEALGDAPELAVLNERIDVLCAKRPLYPGFRGYTTYTTS